MKIPILFITTSDLSGKSGHNIATKEILEAFVNNPLIDIYLICPYPKKIIPERILIKVKEIKYYKIYFRLFPFSLFIAQILIRNKARDLIRKLNLQKKIVIISRLGNFNFSTPQLVEEFKCDFILLIRGLSNFRKGYKLEILNSINEKLSIKNIKLATKIIVAYSEIKDLCINYVDPNRIEIFNNAVDPGKFNIQNKQSLRRDLKLGIGENDFVVGFVGSVSPRHHVKELIHSLEIFKTQHGNKSNRNIKILIVGEGSQSETLKQMVQNSRNLSNADVVFTGFVDHDNVGKYISLCDVMYGVVSPNIKSNPIKCYEYLASGRPIITTKTVEFDFVEHHVLGKTISSLDPKEIIDGFLFFLRLNESELEEMGNRGREYIFENHTWDKLPKMALTSVLNNDEVK